MNGILGSTFMVNLLLRILSESMYMKANKKMGKIWYIFGIWKGHLLLSCMVLLKIRSFLQYLCNVHSQYCMMYVYVPLLIFLVSFFYQFMRKFLSKKVDLSYSLTLFYANLCPLLTLLSANNQLTSTFDITVGQDLNARADCSIIC